MGKRRGGRGMDWRRGSPWTIMFGADAAAGTGRKGRS